MKTETAPATRTADSLAASGRKVHLVVAGLGVACRTGASRNTTPVNHLTDLPENSGRDALLAAFSALDLAPSRLCRNCFTPRVRNLYARTR